MAMAFIVAAAQSAWADDNQIAQHIVQKLKVEQQRGNLKGFHVDLRVDQGTVWFKGFVANAAQEQLILRTAQQAGFLGVVQIVDDIDVRTSNSMASATPPANALIPARESYGQQPALPVSYYQEEAPQVGVGPTAISQAPVAMGQQMGSPMPVAQVAMNGGTGITADHPHLPGYAWPAYAAAPNYAAVSYPRQYSASAWPYIGPFYPYPQVPVGWRNVTVEWDAGWWFREFNDHRR
jgi:hypothetical protein